MVLFSQSVFSEEKTSFIIGSLGDSVTTATNARSWGDMKDSNWSTGTSHRGGLESHFHKLEKSLSKNIIPINVAESGSTSRNIAEQVSELIKNDPDYVTLLIGGNDACSWAENHTNQLSQFEHTIDQAVQKLIEKNNDIKILMVPVPDMYHLWQLGQDDCGWIWDLFGVCSNLLSSGNSDEDRRHFKDRLDDLNKGLKSVSERHPLNTYFDESLSEYKFKKEDVSRKDCFHPSLEGQNKISEMTWHEEWVTQN